MNPTQPRLLPDFAAAPTRRERGAARTHWRNAQGSMFDLAEPMPHACAACAGAHETTDCTHAEALTIPEQETTP